MSRWMLNCKEFAMLASERLDRPLSFWDKVSIKMHLLMCPPCQRIQKQLEALRRACRWGAADRDGMDQEECRLPENARSRIKETLKKHCT